MGLFQPSVSSAQKKVERSWNKTSTYAGLRAGSSGGREGAGFFGEIGNSLRSTFKYSRVGLPPISKHLEVR